MVSLERDASKVIESTARATLGVSCQWCWREPGPSPASCRVLFHRAAFSLTPYSCCCCPVHHHRRTVLEHMSGTAILHYVKRHHGDAVMPATSTACFWFFPTCLAQLPSPSRPLCASQTGPFPFDPMSPRAPDADRPHITPTEKAARLPTSFWQGAGERMR